MCTNKIDRVILIVLMYNDASPTVYAKITTMAIVHAC